MKALSSTAKKPNFSFKKQALELFKKISDFFVKVQTNVFLFVLYFLVVSVFAAIFQITNALKKFGEKQLSSYWVKKDFEQESKRIYQQF